MKFDIHLPCRQLTPFIKHLIISESGVAKTYKVLPGTSLVMGFQYSGKLAHLRGQSSMPLAAAGVTGLMDAYRMFKNTPHTGTVLVIFKEAGAAHFIKTSLNELYNESLSLDHFFDRHKLSEVEQKLSAASGDQQRIRIVEQLFISYLNDKPQDLLVNAAIAKINQSNGSMRIEQLARYLNTSQSPLEKRFRKVVGASPKKYSSLVRIRHTLDNLTPGNYQQIIFMAGYHDQAHFIKDFKTYTGDTPEQFIKAQANINDFLQ